MNFFVAGSLKSDFSVFVLFTQTGFIFNVPLGSTVAFTASIFLQPRSLRACAEPRRASARRGEAPLVLYTPILVHRSLWGSYSQLLSITAHHHSERMLMLAALAFPPPRCSLVCTTPATPVLLPGSYASLNLLGAYLGWPGYDYNSIPSYDD